MTEEARIRLAKALRLDEVPNPVWDNLVERRLAQDYEKGEIELDFLLREARIQLKSHRQTLAETSAGGPVPSGTTDSSKEIEPELGAYEKARAEALGEYLALRASLDPYVRYLRKVILGGELLTPDRARAFVGSPANQCFGVAWFVERRIPMTEHRSHVYGDGWAMDEDGVEYRFDDVYVDPPGEGFRKVTYEPLDFGLRDVLRFPAGRSDFVHGVDEVPVEVGSVLDVLRKTSLRVAEGFGRAWGEPQAAWFVLTGEATPSVALSGRIETSIADEMTRGAITLTAEPWVPAETVSHYYREMQREVLGGKDNRRLLDKSLALFRFFTEQVGKGVPGIERPDYDAMLCDDGGVNVVPSEDDLRVPKPLGRPSWPALLEGWNRHCPNPQWRYKDYRNFRRATMNAARALLHPTYDYPPGVSYKDHTLP